MAIKNNFLLIISIAILIVFSGILNKKLIPPMLDISKQKSAININDSFLNIFDIGQSRLISDFIWITTLLESDLEHYKGNKLNSWMYLRFNTIATMDPMFLRNYQFGGQYLAIIKDDISGAEKLMQRGYKYYPNDYTLNFNLGYLYSIEMDEYKKALPYLEKIKDNKKAPRNLNSLITKIKYMANNDLKNTYKILESLLATTKNLIVQKKIKSELYAIKAEIDLQCLNKKLYNCSTADYDGYAYIRKSGMYYARKSFKKYKLHKKKAH